MSYIRLGCLFLLLVLGCKKQEVVSPAIVEPYVQADGAVGFDAIPQATKPDGSVIWDATYSSPQGTAHFQIEFQPAQSTDKESSIGFGKGRLIAVTGSNPGPLLNALKKALEAKHEPKNVKRNQFLEFTYANLGSGMTRESDGSFDMKPPGSWTALKLFIAAPKGDEEAEVFLNFSAAAKKAEFSMKDPDYGDDILQQLATVL